MQVEGMQLSDISGVVPDKQKDSGKEADNYKWNGDRSAENAAMNGQVQAVQGYRFNYQEYIRMKEEEEEKERSLVRVEVIELDD